MKHVLCSLVILFFSCSFGQTINFAKSEDTIFLSKGDSTNYSVTLNCAGCTGNAPSFTLEVDPGTSLPATEFESQSGNVSFAAGQNSLLYFIHFALTGNSYYGRFVTLKLTQGGQDSYMHIYLHRREEADSARYRFMIGTNFDFVDGVRAKDLYYHLQFFLPDGFGKKFGFIGGIQQNRQVSGLDTAFDFNISKSAFTPDSFRLNKYDVLPNDSFRIIRADSVSLTKTSSSTVLLLYFEPTYKIYKNTSPKAKSDLYLFLHVDLQYKSLREEQTYNYKIRDTVKASRQSYFKYTPIKDKDVAKQALYQFNYGGGVLLHHENKYVDMYVKMMIGAVHLSQRTWSAYYGNELGVRVVPFNIMLGGEYRGLFTQHDPSYLNLYLSKVFSLSKLAEIISK